MFGKFLLRRMLGPQLKDLPEAEREKILDMIEKNPEFFTKLAEDVKAEMAKGVDQQTAALTVLKSKESELKALLGQ